MQKLYRFGLFEVFGIELEYMIVDKDTLNIKPIADKVLIDNDGNIESEISFNGEYGKFNWSNELVNHVIEFKVGEPVNKLEQVDIGFYDQVKSVNEILHQYNAVLMPGGMHPWMNPLKETKLWEHDSSEIYDCFNKIFSCKGHGWSNLQSTHINLPFSNNDEFFRLHTAIRTILPVIPAISAGTPIVEGKLNDIDDNRLMFYKDNCKKIPLITGKVVPELAVSIKDYRNNILKRIFNELQFYDPEGIICHDWVNARGALPNFERGSIEIRIIDIQECPKMDLAITELVVETVKALVEEYWCPLNSLCNMETEDIYNIFIENVKKGSRGFVKNTDYLKIFGIADNGISAIDLWTRVFNDLCKRKEFVYKKEIEFIFNYGCLSQRIRKHLKKDTIKNVYSEMIECLSQNKIFPIQY